MKRPCDACGQSYEAKRPSSKFCSTNCRVKANRSGTLPGSVVPIASASVSSGIVASIERRLTAVDRLDTVAGQQAMFLAERITHEISGSAVAAMSRELRAVMDVALEGVAVAADPLDELKARRDRLRSG